MEEMNTKAGNVANQSKDRTWGIGIAVFYSAFVIVILGLVFFATLQRFDLVADSYYEDGVKYQQRIDQKKLAESDEYKIDVSYIGSTRTLEIAFPVAIAPDSILGNVVLFRPSNAALDRKWDIVVGPGNRQAIDLRDARDGVWKIMVYWKAGDTELYSEKSIYIE